MKFTVQSTKLDLSSLLKEALQLFAFDSDSRLGFGRDDIF